MPSEFRLPALGADMESGTVVEWRVAPGAAVRRGDVVAVVETDKGALDVEIFEDGVVGEILVPVGVKVPVGTVLLRLGAAEAGHRLHISPAARRRARELEVEVEQLRGSGPDGAITLEDVEAAAQGGAPAAGFRPLDTAAMPAPQPPGDLRGAPAADERAGMRAAIAAAMSRSKREIPHYYLATTIDVTPAVDWLAAHNGRAPVTERLLLAALLVKALALTCRATPGFSGFYRDGRYEESPAVHVGVAVALRGGGLVAPAIVDAGERPLAEVMTALRELVARARAGRLRASELAAPTIILTSLGEDAVDAVFPVIQPPQVAIVGAGTVATRPWVVDGVVVPRQVITLSLGADHRVTDGRLGGQFLARIAAKLVQPGSL